VRAQDPGAVVDWLPEDDVDVLLARAESALWRGDPATGLVAAEIAVEEAPWRSDGQIARARALEALGRGEEAADAWARAWELDPGGDGGPVRAGRVASTFRYVVVAPGTATEAPSTVKGPPL
jgi:hypothetical protein